MLANLPGIEIVAEAADGIGAIALARKHRPALITLDVAMPKAAGMEVFGEVRRWSPDTKIAVITGFTSQGLLASWVQAGADGLFLKTCDAAELREGIENILDGQNVIQHEIQQALQDFKDPDSLTKRERQVLHLVAEGRTSADIADRLSISRKTVDNHRMHIMSKLDLHSVAELVAYAFKEGLLDPAAQIPITGASNGEG